MLDSEVRRSHTVPRGVDKESALSEVWKTVYSCSRRGPRHRLRYADEAFVEFNLSEDRTWRLDLLDLGTGGLCFGLENGQLRVDVGSTIDGAVLQIGDVRIAGSLSIAHVTEEFSAGTICGARFQPATETDKSKLADLMAALGG